MKKVSVLSVAAALLFSANAFATETEPNPVSPAPKVTAEIGNLLEDNNFVLEDNKDIQFSVRFTLNDAGEIVVLSVNTSEDKIESFVKARLNYQQVETTGMETGKTYEVPVRITA